MYVVRDIFRCKPGKAKALIEKFRLTLESSEREDGFRNSRVLVDFVADYWTVVFEAEFERLEQFEHHMNGYGTRPEVRAAMEGYMDLVEGGRREIFRVV
jgi:heme-degrading monooxygenase HmoA